MNLASPDTHGLAAVADFLASRAGRALILAAVLALVYLFCRPLRGLYHWVGRLLFGGLVLRKPGNWDSTFDRAAPERPSERPAYRGETYPRTRWARMPGYQRMLIRWAAGAYIVALLWYPLPVVVVSVLAFVALCSRKAGREIRDWAIGRASASFVPAASTLLRYDKRDPATWLAMPRVRLVRVPIVMDTRVLRLARRVPRIGDRLEHFLGALWVPQLRVPLEDDDARLVVSLDADMIDKAAADEVGRLAKARLPEGPWEATHHEGRLEIVIKHPARPPSEVWYDEDAFRTFGLSEIPIGKDASNSWVVIPLRDLTPHGVMSASTGWCKTTTANVMVAHLAGNGGRVFINDPKRIGYLAAFGGIGHVVIRSTAEGWAHSYQEFLDEMTRRYELIERFPEIEEDPEKYFQPWYLLNDERGSLVSDLKDWWKSGVDEDDKKRTGLPGPLRQEKKILWQARAAGMHVIDLAQQAGREVMVDTDGRDQRMWRLASGPQSREAWYVLFPGVGRKKIAVKKGRALLGIGIDTQHEITLARVTKEEARNYAINGETIAQRENELREKRISELLEGSVPARDTGSLPGGTPPGVQGQSQDVQVPDSPAELANLSVIDGGGESAGQAQENEINSTKNDTDGQDGNVPGQDTEQDARQDAAGPDSDLVVGISGAVEFLREKGYEINEDGFTKARTRAKARDGWIPETRRGMQPAWKALDLAEWQAQRPRAGRPASGE